MIDNGGELLRFIKSDGATVIFCVATKVGRRVHISYCENDINSSDKWGLIGPCRCDVETHQSPRPPEEFLALLESYVATFKD